jgi:UbiD family decarboxylase
MAVYPVRKRLEARALREKKGRPKTKSATQKSGAASDYRAALEIADSRGELARIRREVDPLIEIPAVLRACAPVKPVPALLFENVKGYPGKRVVGNLFAEHGRFSHMCGFAEQEAVTKFSYLDALDNPLPPVLVDIAPCQENVFTGSVEVERYLPPTHGALNVTRKYYQPVVCTKHPKTGTINLSVYRACIQPDGRLTVNIRWDQHGGLFLKQAIERGEPLPVAICIGTAPAVYVAAVSKLPYSESETGFAGSMLGEPLEMVKCKTIDLEVPAATEIVIEGEIRPPYEKGDDGPWPEFLGYLGMEIHPPIVDVTCLTHRNDPIANFLIPASVPHLLGTATQAQLYRFLRSMFGEFVLDSYLLPRTSFHNAVIKIHKTEAHQEGLQMNLALAAFGFINYLDKVTVVDEDVNIYDPLEIEWAGVTRCDPAKQIHVLPQARTHQNNPIGGVQETFNEPITKAKLVVDATIPWKMKQVKKEGGITFFTKSQWPPADLSDYLEPDDRRRILKQR